MVRLFYTGAQNFLSIQRMPIKSTGGFISSSLVPNGSLGNLFDDISDTSIQENLKEVRCLALKNETENRIEVLNVKYIYPKDSFVKIRIAAIDPSKQKTDTGCEFFFEKVPTQRSLPVYSSDFTEANSDYATCKLEFNNPFNFLEVVTILGKTLPPAPNNLTLEQTYSFVKEKFSHVNYTCEFVSKETKQLLSTGVEVVVLETYLLFTNKELGEDNSVMTFTTSSTTTPVQLDSFSGGVDNLVNIGPIEPGEYVGIWFIKELNKEFIKSQEKVEDFDSLEKTDNISLIFEY